MSVRELMIELGGTFAHGDQSRWFDRIADAANITRRTARSLWRREISDDNHRGARAIREAIKRRERERELASQLADARKETAAIAAQYAKIIGGMRAQDENFFGPEIDRLERLVDRLGPVDRS